MFFQQLSSSRFVRALVWPLRRALKQPMRRASKCSRRFGARTERARCRALLIRSGHLTGRGVARIDVGPKARAQFASLAPFQIWPGRSPGIYFSIDDSFIEADRVRWLLNHRYTVTTKG